MLGEATDALREGAGDVLINDASFRAEVGEILKKIGNRNFEHLGALRALARRKRGLNYMWKP